MTFPSPILLLLVCLLLGAAPEADAFVPQIDYNERGQIVSISWPSTEAASGLTFHVNTDSFPFASRDIDRIVAASFQAWDEIDTAALTFINGGSGNFRKSSTDRRNVITFDPSGVEIGAPAGSGVIAITTINWDEQGRVSDADITFNGRDFDFSVADANPPPGVVDLQDVMTHEIGHLIGLDHSPLTGPTRIRPTMNPFASQEDPGAARSLEPDDIAGATALYPGTTATRLGTVTGRVTDPDGAAAFGVHVIAFDAETGDFVVSALSGAAGENKGPSGDGRYEISGLPPGAYRIGIAPVNGGISADNFGGIFTQFRRGFESEYYENADRPSLGQVLTVESGRPTGPIDFVLGLTVPGFPEISVQQLPVNTPDAGGPYPVHLTITDDGSVVSASVSYRVDGSGFATAPMRRSTGDGWIGEIPGAAPGAEVEYQIQATDDDGNTTTFPPEASPPLSFEVIALSGEPVVYVVMSGSNLLSTLDSGTGREVARLETGITPHDAVITPDEAIVFVANTGLGTQTSRTVTAISTATHRTLASIDVGFGPLDMAVSPAGDRVYVTNSDSRSISAIDVRALSEEKRISLSGLSDGPFGIAISPDGKTVYATDIGSDQVFVVDPEAGTVTDRIGVVSAPRSLAVSPDGQTLYVSGFEGGISVVDLVAASETARIQTASGVFRVKVSPDGSTLYATSQDAASLLVIDTSSGAVVRTAPVLPGGENTRGLTVSGDGRRVYVTNAGSNDLVVFDAETLSILESYKLGEGPRAIVVRNDPLGSAPSGTTIALSDFDSDGVVGFNDFLLFANAFGTSAGDAGFDGRFDLDGSGSVDFADFLSFAQAFGHAVLN